MDAIVELAVRRLYAQAGITTSEACGSIRLATAILGARCIRVVPRETIPGNAALSWAGRRPVIHIREGLTRHQLNHSTAHELGEWHLRTSGYAGPDPEELVGRITAALCVPRRAFHAARRRLGENIPALSRAFGVSESLMALRIGECLGHSTALITKRRVRTRGRRRDWPETPEGWRELIARPGGSGVIVHRIQDAKGRVALLVR
jgi:hypothetical protein